MANPATLYRFRLNVSDVERGFYESLDFRVGMHPSETEDYLLTRVIAYALNYESGLEFAPGLCTADEPAIRLLGPNGEIALWIDIGNPAARRIHKASKASKRVRIYTYKNPESLKAEALKEEVHRASEIEVFSFSQNFLSGLAPLLKRDNAWSLIHTEGELIVTIKDGTEEKSVMGTLEAHRLG